jgi:hypothetical protein
LERETLASAPMPLAGRWPIAPFWRAPPPVHPRCCCYIRGGVGARRLRHRRCASVRGALWPWFSPVTNLRHLPLRAPSCCFSCSRTVAFLLEPPLRDGTVGVDTQRAGRPQLACILRSGGLRPRRRLGLDACVSSQARHSVPRHHGRRRAGFSPKLTRSADEHRCGRVGARMLRLSPSSRSAAQSTPDCMHGG